MVLCRPGSCRSADTRRSDRRAWRRSPAGTIRGHRPGRKRRRRSPAPSCRRLGATTAFAVTDRLAASSCARCRPARISFAPTCRVRRPARTGRGGACRARARPPRSRFAASAPARLSRRPSCRRRLAASTEAPSRRRPNAAPPAAEQCTERDAAKTTDGETAWRLRHARREHPEGRTLHAGAHRRRRAVRATAGSVRRAGSAAVGSPARVAANFFADTPFSGQVNLLTTGSFDAPQQLFSHSTAFSPQHRLRAARRAGRRSRATGRCAARSPRPTSRRGSSPATTSTRGPARHRYDIGLSYSTQRYDGGNSLALRDVTDGSRNAGTVYGFDTFAVTPALTLTYGARYARYDYLEPARACSARASR